MKILTIIGARPQFIKASIISSKIKFNYKSLTEVIIHTGQHYEKNMSQIFFDEMDLPEPKYNLGINSIEYGQMIHIMIKKIIPILRDEKADAVLVYGDTNSTLAGSIAAKLSKIPLFHIEAGLRSFDRAMPEENNRIISDHLSTLLFCPTKNSTENLKKENITKNVFLSGDVMLDVFNKFKTRKNSIDIGFSDSEFILSTIHRRENLNSSEN